MAAGFTLTKVVAFCFLTGGVSLSLQQGEQQTAASNRTGPPDEGAPNKRWAMVRAKTARVRAKIEAERAWWKTDKRKEKTDKIKCYKDTIVLTTNFISNAMRFGSYLYYSTVQDACNSGPDVCLRLIFGMIEPFFVMPSQFQGARGDCTKWSARQQKLRLVERTVDETDSQKAERDAAKDKLDATKQAARNQYCDARRLSLIGSTFAGLGHDIMQLQQTCFAPGELNKKTTFLVEPCVASAIKSAAASVGPLFGLLDLDVAIHNCKIANKAILDRDACPVLFDKVAGLAKASLVFTAFLLNSLSQCTASDIQNKQQVCAAASVTLAAEVSNFIRTSAYSYLLGCISSGHVIGAIDELDDGDLNTEGAVVPAVVDGAALAAPGEGSQDGNVGKDGGVHNTATKQANGGASTGTAGGGGAVGGGGGRVSD